MQSGCESSQQLCKVSCTPTPMQVSASRTTHSNAWHGWLCDAPTIVENIPDAALERVTRTTP
eukprot:515788-Lingulodinium_polyedra.AAC.1